MFIPELYRRGFLRSLMKPGAVDSRTWAHHFRSSSSTKSKSFRPTECVQTLTTAHILMPTGCHRLDVCGIVAGAGSQGISSEKRRQKRGGRGKMLGKQQRSKKTSVMESGCPTYIGSMGKVVYALAFSY